MTAQQAVALVTGASSGIGEAVTIGLVEAGFRVVGTSRDASALTGREGRTFVDLNVSNDASVTAAVEDVLGRFGRVNNAGIGSAGAAEELSVAQDRKVIRRQRRRRDPDDEGGAAPHARRGGGAS